MRPEARVGLVVVVGALLLAGLAAFLGWGVLRERGYEFTVIFDNAEGLTPGTPVGMAGVQVGVIRDLHLTPDHRAAVRVRVRPDVAIPSDSRFVVASGTLLGNRYLAVFPGSGPHPIQPGDQVHGERGFSLEDVYGRIDALSRDLQGAIQEVRLAVRDVRALVRSAGGVVEGLEAAVAGVRRTVGDPRIRQALVRASGHIEEASASVERTSRRVEGIAAAVGSDVRDVSRSLRALAEQLLTTAREVDRFVADVAAEGKTASQLRRTVASVEQTARRIEQMTRTLQEGLVNEEQVREVRGLIAETRTTVRRANEVMDRVGRGVEALAPVLERIQQGTPLLPSLSFTYELSYDSRTMFRHDLDLWVARREARYYRVGLHDIGRGNLLQLQGGFRLADNLGWRVGLVDGQLGVGLDYAAPASWTFAADLYNLNRLTLNLSAHYAASGNWAIGVHLRDLLQTPSYGLGVQYRF